MKPVESIHAAPAPTLRSVRELGLGAIGHVQLVELLEPFAGLPAGSLLACKRLREELQSDPVALASLAGEADIGTSVSDPGLVKIYGLYSDLQGPLVLEEYVAGRSLRETLLRDGPLPEPLVRHVGRQLASTLRALHRAGFVHGDIKPENVRLDEQGKATLLDLGFARRLSEARGIGAGSLPFMSPERLRGGGPTSSSDVFALGVMLYELLTQRHPFASELSAKSRRSLISSQSSSLNAIESGRPNLDLERLSRAEIIPPSHFAPRSSPLLDALLASLLDRRAAARPSAEATYRILHEGESGPWWRRRIDEALLDGQDNLWIAFRGHRLPLVGRTEELAQLQSVYDQIVEPDLQAIRRTPRRRGQVVLLRGSSGSGKSRLVEAFIGLVRRSQNPPLVLMTRVSEHAESRPFGALLKLLRRYLQLPDQAKPDEREEKLLSGLLPPLEAQVLLAALNPESSAELPGSVVLAIARFVAALGQRRPVVVLIDDLQHAREGSLDGVGRLVTALELSSVLLILGLDPEVEAAAGAELDKLIARLRQRRTLGFRELPISPLLVEEVSELVQRLFHHSVPRLRLGKVLWERSRGHAGLISEILEGLYDRGEAREASEEDPRWLLLMDPERMPIPRSFQASLRERYRRLDAPTRRWLERLAVVGGRIEPLFLLRTFAPVERAEIDGVLTTLVRRGWLEAAGERYRFSRPALRDAVYRAIRPERRRRLHRLAARSLSLEAVDNTRAQLAYQRAFHLRAAEDWAELLANLRVQVDWMARRGSPRRVLKLAEWGLEAHDALPAAARTEDLELWLLETAVDAADRIGDRKSGRRLLDRLSQKTVDPLAEPGSAARSHLLHARYSEAQNQVELAEHLLDEAIRFAKQSGQPALQSEAWRRRARQLADRGEFEAADHLLQQSLEAATSPAQTARAHFVRAHVAVLEDRFEPALNEVSLGIRALHGDRSRSFGGLIAGGLLMRTRALRSAGRSSRALAAADRCLELCRQSGELRFEAETLARMGGLLIEVGRVEQAEAHLREACLLAGELEDGRSLCLAEIGLAVLLAERSDPDVRPVLNQAIQHATQANFPRGEAVSLALLARVELLAQDLPAALAASERAMGILERVGAELFDRVTIVGSRALVLEAAGRGADGRNLERNLRALILDQNQRLQSPGLRASHRIYSNELLDLMLSAHGPLTPKRPGEYVESSD